MSLEASVLSMQQKLIELEAQQHTLIQEAVAHATTAALKDIETMLSATQAKQQASIQEAVAHATATVVKDIETMLSTTVPVFRSTCADLESQVRSSDVLDRSEQLQPHATADQLGVGPKSASATMPMTFLAAWKNVRERRTRDSHAHSCRENPVGGGLFPSGISSDEQKSQRSRNEGTDQTVNKLAVQESFSDIVDGIFAELSSATHTPEQSHVTRDI